MLLFVIVVGALVLAVVETDADGVSKDPASSFESRAML